MNSRSAFHALILVVLIVAVPAAHAQKSWFNTSEQLRSSDTPNYLVSANRAFYAVVNHGDRAKGSYGGFEIHKGSGPLQDFGQLWATTPDLTNNGTFFLAVQPDANLCVYRGTSPSNILGRLWCSMATRAQGPFFVAMQDDGNLCVYAGQHPGDNRGGVWCSGTNTPISWLPTSRTLSFPSNGPYGKPVRQHLCGDGNGVNLTTTSAGCSYWTFDNGMLRSGQDGRQCLTHEADGSMTVRACSGFSGQLHWMLAADKTLRKADFSPGDTCLEPAMTKWTDATGPQWSPPKMTKPCTGTAKFDH